MDERPSRRPVGEPAWILAAIGWLAGSLPFAQRGEVAEGTAGVRPAPRDLTKMAPRELRRVPGIGEGHAIAIARARWQHRPGSGYLYIDDVYGIGPATRDRVRAWLDQGGVARAPDAITPPARAPALPERGAPPARR
ncbi:MAG TPA: hypothetical protein VMS76_05705 [Planctomycetota bacterium]|nr:hypothetical protein [Planctomycetota bacterium]